MKKRSAHTRYLAAAGFLALLAINALGTTLYVDVNGANPTPPYTNWSTAAVTIQDAINAANPGDLVLVTNGVYATGGKVMAGDLTNRVALDKALIVQSVNGPIVTTIQGTWDPATTNGPLAVRCAWLTNGATLSGFTLQNGATRTDGLDVVQQSGGGTWCSSTNAMVSNCVLTNNQALFGGGGACSGTLNNCLLARNGAYYGGGAIYATLNNCTVLHNFCRSSYSNGGGIYDSTAQNCVLLYNFLSSYAPSDYPANWGSFSILQFSCTSPLPSGTGNTNADPQFLDFIHISALSPCRSAGSSIYSGGTDLDGEAWANPPSMGCDEVVETNLVGPLQVGILTAQTNLVVNHPLSFTGLITGRVSRLEWSFGDGPVITNAGYATSHNWANAGDYEVVLTAYNTDYPGGIATNLFMSVAPLYQPLLESTAMATNGFQFQFYGQKTAFYTVQMATNLAAPISWQTRQVKVGTNGPVLFRDSAGTNGSRFYRVLAQ
jgi:hypothetical protein